MSLSVEKAFVHSIEYRDVSRTADEKTVQLAELRCRIDRSYRSGEKEDGSPRYSHDKDYWVNVEVWGGRVNALRDVVLPGAAILMTGRYHVGEWEDDDGTKRLNVAFRAADIAILPWCIETPEYKYRDKEASADAGNYDGDIPF